MNLYQERIMEYYRAALYQGELIEPTFSSGWHNPTCGDSVIIDGCIEEGVLTEAAFRGKGCVISQAAASMLLERVINLPIQDILSFNADAMKSLIGIELGPLRMKCALLALEALHKGIADAQSR